MTLRKGKSKRTIDQNVAELIASGKSQAQAVAIAMDSAGKSGSRIPKRKRKAKSI